MNILFIHEVDWLRKVVYEIHDLSELLSIAEHNVFAIDYENSWKREHLLDIGTLKTKEFEKVSRAHEGTSVTLRRPGMIKLPFLSRLTGFFTHYFEIEKTIKEKDIDVIILYSVPTNGLQTIRLAKKYNIPVIFRSIDILHQMVDHWFLRMPTYMLEKIVYKNVDKVLTLTPKLSDYVVRMDASEDKVEMLPPGIDTNKFNPNVDTVELKDKLGLNDNDKIVVFIGTLFKFSGLDKYMEQFPSILKEIPEAKLVIVGGGELFEKLKKRTVELRLEENVILMGFQPYDMMPQYINLADVCINSFLINDITKDIIPTKILQYLACGKPVIATSLPGMMSILPNEDYGIVYSNVDDFAQNTIRLLKDTKARSIGQNGYQYVKHNHDWCEICCVLESKLNNLKIRNVTKSVLKDT